MKFEIYDIQKQIRLIQKDYFEGENNILCFCSFELEVYA